MLNQEILLKRAGKFTASENHRLMAGWETPVPSKDYPEFIELYRVMKVLDKKPLVGDLKGVVNCKVSGDLINQTWQIIQQEKPPAGLVAYAKEKAIEEFFFPDPSFEFSTIHTRNGEEREAYCMALLAEKTGLNFVHTGDNQVHVHADEVGCTPDGIILDDELDLIKTGAEVKCKSPIEHAKNMMIKNNDDLKINAFDHFVQIQTAMLVTGTDHWYFANYNPCAKDERLQFGYIIIERDDAFIKILKSRIDIAKKIKAGFYVQIASIINSKKSTQEAA